MVKELETSISGLQGEIYPPADKSISHRSVILGALAEGETVVENILIAEDTKATMDIVKLLGVNISICDKSLKINSRGFHYLINNSKQELNAYNSGTTMRLMLGILAGINDLNIITGDSSLNKRPMDRVIIPLKEMGANFQAYNGKFSPITITGNQLKGINYELSIPSAQVKSAIILAALFADGETKIIEPILSRNHTEQMLPLFQGKIYKKGDTLIVPGNQKLIGTKLVVPNDFSSAAFWIVAALIIPNSKIIIKDVNLNPTRTGLLTVLKEMNANIKIKYKREELGDIYVEYSSLKSTIVEGDIIPTLIDELPLLALAATQAKGTTIIRDAQELRVKESDRISKVALELNNLGANVMELKDGMVIDGEKQLIGAKVDSHKDHRIGMMLAIASQVAKGKTELLNSQVVNISYPNFWSDLDYLKGNKD